MAKNKKTKFTKYRVTLTPTKQLKASYRGFGKSKKEAIAIARRSHAAKHKRVGVKGYKAKVQKVRWIE